MGQTKKSAVKQQAGAKSTAKSLQDALELIQKLKNDIESMKNDKQELGRALLDKDIELSRLSKKDETSLVKDLVPTLANLVEANVVLTEKLMEETVNLTLFSYTLTGREIDVERTRPLAPPPTYIVNMALVMSNQRLDWVLGKLRTLNASFKGQIS